jgi:hypothetical protein
MAKWQTHVAEAAQHPQAWNMVEQPPRGKPRLHTQAGVECAEKAIPANPARRG